jgi:hypothetical protein
MPSQPRDRVPISSTADRHHAVAPTAATAARTPYRQSSFQMDAPARGGGSKQRFGAAVAPSPSTPTNFFQGEFSHV